MFSKRLRPITPIKWLNKYWDVLSVSEQVGVGHVTVLDQWGGAVWDNRLSLAGLSRVSGEGGRGVKKTGCLLECQSEEQEVWHVRVDFNKVTDKRRSSVSSVKRGRYVGTRRFRVRGQRTPELNALIAAKLIASINALTLTALVIWCFFVWFWCGVVRSLVTCEKSLSYSNEEKIK